MNENTYKEKLSELGFSTEIQSYWEASFLLFPMGKRTELLKLLSEIEVMKDGLQSLSGTRKSIEEKMLGFKRDTLSHLIYSYHEQVRIEKEQDSLQHIKVEAERKIKNSMNTLYRELGIEEI